MAYCQLSNGANRLYETEGDFWIGSVIGHRLHENVSRTGTVQTTEEKGTGGEWQGCERVGSVLGVIPGASVKEGRIKKSAGTDVE